MTKVIIVLRYLREGSLKRYRFFCPRNKSTRGADIYPYPLLTSVVEVGKRSTSRPGRFTTRKKYRHQLNRELIETRCGNFEKRKKSL